MRSKPDEETLELARALSTRAGMLLEDVSAQVVLVGELDAEELRSVIGEAQRMLSRARHLLDCAAVLLGADWWQLCPLLLMEPIARAVRKQSRNPLQ